MTFPLIRHIDDVLPAIAGRKEFVVSERDGYTAIDYVYADVGSFDHPVARECRGIKFDAEGWIMARPFHKFFNIGERDETQPHNLDVTRAHVVLDKLDGSMVHPAMVDGRLAFMTRAGETDIAADALRFAEAHQATYFALCSEALAAGFTPIFEWCAPGNRIVIRYGEPRLVLLALRSTIEGSYTDHARLESYGRQHGVPVVGSWGHGDGSRVSDLDAFIAHARALTDAEGYVIRFHDGHMVKIKADDYVLRHKSKDQIGLEKNALAVVLNNAVDDMVPLLPEPDADALRFYAKAIAISVAFCSASIRRQITLARESGADRKTFAVDYVQKLTPLLRGPAFQAWDGGDPVDMVKTMMLKHTKTSTDVDKIRDLIGGLRWEDFYGATMEEVT